MGDNIVHIVSHDISAERKIGLLLDSIGMEYITFYDGMEALNELKESGRTVSIIIYELSGAGMRSDAFLEQAASISPDTMRLVICSIDEIRKVKNLFLKGVIRKYLIKPCRDEDLIDTVKRLAEEYDLAIEDIKRFRLAKQQNSRLLELNRALNETAERHAVILNSLDPDLIFCRISPAGDKPGASIKRIRDKLERSRSVKPDKIDGLYLALLNRLAFLCMRSISESKEEFEMINGGVESEI